MNKRSVSWFVNEVRKQIQRAPARAVRLDITEEERPAIMEACNALTGYRCKWTPHADPLLRKQGLCRAAFFGPCYQWPMPVKTTPVKWPKAKNDQAATRRAQASFTHLDKLKRQYGPEYHVELKSRWLSLPPVLEVWRGVDWLAVNTAAFYPAEVARCLDANIIDSVWLEPDAERGHKVLCAAKQSGSKQAKIHKAKLDCALADLVNYRNKNPNVSLTEARERIATKHCLSRKTLERGAARK